MEPNREFDSVWIPDESLKIDHVSETYHWGYPLSGNFKARVDITTYKLPGGIPHCRFAIARTGALGTILRSHDHESGAVLFYPYRGETYSKVRGKITNELSRDNRAAFVSTLPHLGRMELVTSHQYSYVVIPPHTDKPVTGVEPLCPTLEELFGGSE